jgi:DNA-binding HxlR family transcriptional regulator
MLNNNHTDLVHKRKEKSYLIMYNRKIPVKTEKGIDIAFLVIGGKWKRDIILCIVEGKRNPSGIQRELSLLGASARVVRQQIKELVIHGIIRKHINSISPLRVEYHLTDIGLQLIPLFERMNHWGEKYEQNTQTIIKSVREVLLV